MEVEILNNISPFVRLNKTFNWSTTNQQDRLSNQLQAADNGVSLLDVASRKARRHIMNEWIYNRFDFMENRLYGEVRINQRFHFQGNLSVFAEAFRRRKI